MKQTALLLMILVPTLAAAQADRNPLETVEQARQRQSAENYQTYRRNDSQLPPSYNRPLGDPEQRGVERPGYVSPPPVYQPRRGSDGGWQDRAKGRW